MTGILFCAGGVGFVASFTFLQLGVTSMALRYPLAAAAGYACFLALLGLWLHYSRTRRKRARDLDPADLLDVGDLISSSRPRRGRSLREECPEPDPPPTSKPGTDLPGIDMDFDEAAVILIPIVIVLGCLGAAVYAVYIAPALFAEILFEGLLLSGVYRRLRRLEPDAWYSVAFRRTMGPFIAFAAGLAAVGYLAELLVPSAHSIGDVFGA